MIHPGRFFDLLSLRRPTDTGRTIRTFIALSLALAGGVLQGQEKRDLSSLSVDDLMNVEVTSVARKGQKLSDTAAAVFVITQEDIRRSGATSIPEILRMVPGLDVARINGNTWAISARGFNSQFANKLLVMIDGRSIYTPLFSGVYWDVADTLIEDVDRIEVIRGPGGTLWGANAVNGIINIITKHSIETQGTLVSAGAGTADGSSGEARYGGTIGPNGAYRLFGKSYDRSASVEGAHPTHDALTLGRAGFRADWTSRKGDSLTAQGDIYRGTSATIGPIDPAAPFAGLGALDHVSAEDLQFRWMAVQSSRSDTKLQASYDYSARSQPIQARGTLDVDFQQHLKIGDRNDSVWGAAYRNVNDRVGGIGLALVRDSAVSSLVSAFIQDEIQVTHRFHITAGTKVEYASASHLQLQPTLRLLFKASDRQTIWAAATSAVRTPSELEIDGRITVAAFPDGRGGTGLEVVTGNPAIKPERVESFEAGYRWQASSAISLDASAFHNRMRHLIGTENDQPFLDASGQTIVPITFRNSVNGNANGAELLLTDSFAANWNVALSYSFFQSGATLGDVSSPRHQLQLRSSLQLPQQLELDWSAYSAGRLGSDVPAYVRVDGRVSWHPARRWEFAISGQNLLHASHTEFAAFTGASTPVQRTVNGKVTWRF